MTDYATHIAVKIVALLSMRMLKVFQIYILDYVKKINKYDH